MKISLSATNPCHLWDMARELHRLNALGRYYSGYPRWRLRDAASLPVACHSARTYATYLLNRLPSGLRPNMHNVFLWQDEGFDRWTGGVLEGCDFIHAMPGQALHTFGRARQLGIRTVLNHATGPLWRQNDLLAAEFVRAGLRPPALSDSVKALEEQHLAEYALADFHCAASTVVRDQLIGEGIPENRIWVIPYGADDAVFHPGTGTKPSSEFRIVFAGQLILRKGLRTLLEALSYLGRNDWRLDCYGTLSRETLSDRRTYRGKTEVFYHGPVSARRLASAFRGASLLVLPSLEEGFGLVVPQALSCGLPCIVSDATGARDLIRHRENGSVFPVKNYTALAEEIDWWSQHPSRPGTPQSWALPARMLLDKSLEPPPPR